MNEIKISVILPVYNVKSYIREALDSIINQTLKEIEIICVDDGSTDGSLAILQEYQEKDARFLIISQENQGAGAARNLGLDRAKGKYLLFLDPDDFFELKMFQSLYEQAEKTNSEITICQFQGFNHLQQSFYPMEGAFVKKNIPDKEVFSWNDFPRHILSTFSVVVWNKLLLREFVVREGARFQETFRVNDVYFVACSMVKAKRITTVSEVFVSYRTNMCSDSRKRTETYPLSQYQAFFSIFNMLEKEDPEIKDYFVPFALKHILASYDKMKSYEGKKAVYDKIHLDMEKDFALYSLPSSYFQPTLLERYDKMQKLCYEAYLYETLEQERIDKAKTYLRYLAENCDSLCFFGSGFNGQLYLDFFRQYQIPFPKLFCDNNKALQGSVQDGIPIVSFQEALEQFQDLSVIITVPFAYQEIYRQVTEKIPEHRVFFISL